jgi:hypothetical protein
MLGRAFPLLTHLRHRTAAHVAGARPFPALSDAHLSRYDVIPDPRRIIRANVNSPSRIADRRGAPHTLSPLSLTLIVRSEVPLASVAPPMRALPVPMSAATLPAAASQKTGAPRATATAAFGSSQIPSSATSTFAPPIASKTAIPNRAPTCTACPLSTPPVGATRVTTRAGCRFFAIV